MVLVLIIPLPLCTAPLPLPCVQYMATTVGGIKSPRSRRGKYCLVAFQQEQHSNPHVSTVLHGSFYLPQRGHCPALMHNVEEGGIGDLSTRRENCREYRVSELVVPEDSIVIATIGQG